MCHSVSLSNISNWNYSQPLTIYDLFTSVKADKNEAKFLLNHFLNQPSSTNNLKIERTTLILTFKDPTTLLSADALEALFDLIDCHEKLKDIITLQLEGCKLEVVAHYFFSRLSKSEIKNLVFVNCQLSESFVTQLSSEVYHLKTKIHALFVGQQEFESYFPKLFFSFLENNPCLEQLQIEDCLLNLKAMSILAKYLAKNTYLKTLMLIDCGLINLSVQLLLPAIEHHPRLENLNLSCNELSDEAIVALGQMLQKRYPPIHLDLSYNTQISDFSASYLISKAYNLKTIDLSHSIESLDPLRKAYKRKTLEVFKVSDAIFSSEMVQEFLSKHRRLNDCAIKIILTKPESDEEEEVLPELEENNVDIDAELLIKIKSSEPSTELIEKIRKSDQGEFYFDKLIERQYKIHSIPDTGDCLYASFIKGLKYLKIKPKHVFNTYLEMNKKDFANLISAEKKVSFPKETILRTIVSHYIKKHDQEFIPYITEDDVGREVKPSDYVHVYCQKIQENTWGGQIEIAALNQAFDLDIEIQIISLDQVKVDNRKIIPLDEGSDDKLKMIFYLKNHHYQLLTPL